MLMGRVEFGRIPACLPARCSKSASTITIVLVNRFALSKIDEAEAQRVFEFLDGMVLDGCACPSP